MTEVAERDGSGQVTLAEVLDLSAAGPLLADLSALRGRPVRVHAGQVRRLGAQCLQVLISATVSWQAEGASVHVVCRSDEFRRGLALFGAESLLIDCDSEGST